MTFDVTSPWVNQDEGNLFIGSSIQQSIGINFFKGPFNVNMIISGNLAIPPTSPATGFGRLNWVAGNKAFVKARAGDEQGRLSEAVIIEGIII